MQAPPDTSVPLSQAMQQMFARASQQSTDPSSRQLCCNFASRKPISMIRLLICHRKAGCDGTHIVVVSSQITGHEGHPCALIMLWALSLCKGEEEQVNKERKRSPDVPGIEGSRENFRSSKLPLQQAIKVISEKIRRLLPGSPSTDPSHT